MNHPNCQNKLIERPAQAEFPLHVFLQLSGDLFCIRGEEGYFKQFNPTWKNVLGWTCSELLHTPWIELVHPDDRDYTLIAETQVVENGLYQYKNRYRHKNGSYRWLSWTVSRQEDGLFYAVGKDITTVQQTKKVLRDRLALEKLVTTLSTHFISLSCEEIDTGINDALQVIGEFSGFDRGYIVLLSDQPSGVRPIATYEWCAASLEPLSIKWQQFSTTSEWWMEKLRCFECIVISNLDDLPQEASPAKLAMQSIGAQSLVAVPLVQGKTLIGYIGFAAVKDEKTGSDDTVPLLRIVGEIVANALNRKQAELNLRESEKRFRAVFNQTFQFSSLLQLDGTVLADNQTAMDFCRTQPLGSVGQPFWELRCWTISPTTQQQLKQAIAQAAAGHVVRYEVDVLAPDDTIVPVDFSIKPLKDETGHIELLIAEGRDLTERKQVEQELQCVVAQLTEWQNRYEAAGQVSGQLLYDWNIETNQLVWGQNVQQVLGYAPGELQGGVPEWDDFLHPDDQERIFSELAVLKVTKEPVHLEYRIRKKDGTYIIVSDNGKFYPDRDGNLNRLVGFIVDITNRKQAETALRDSEARFRAIFEQAAVGISQVNISGQFLWFNQWYCDFLGYTRAELLHKSFQDITHPDDLQADLEAVQRLCTGEISSYSMEKRYIRKDGQVQWVTLTVSPLRNAAGELKHVIGVVEDIQERKQAQQALTESEERWQLALRGNNDSIWDLNFKTNQCFHSCRWKEILGYAEHEVSNYWDDWESIVHPDDLGWVNQVRQQHLAGKTPFYKAEYRIRCKDGSYKWILSRAQAVWDEAGNPVRMVGSHTDISDRKQAEAALQQSLLELEQRVEERTLELQQANEQLQAKIIQHQDTEAALRQREEQFRRVFEEAPIGMSLETLDYQFIEVNRTLCEMLGYTEAELTVLKSFDIVHPEDWQQELLYEQQLLAGEIDSYQFEQRLLTKNQAIVWVNLTVTVLRDEVGTALYILGMAEDITKRKQAEEEIRKALAKEKELSELRSSFVSLVSHEFRTPLTTIQSSAELLTRYDDRLSTERKLNHLSRIQIAVNRMTYLLEDVLMIGKADAGKLKFEPAPLDLVTFCHDLVESLQISLPEKHKIDVVVQGNCANAHMDEKLLSHILTNLLSNSIKYSPAGGTVYFELLCLPDSAVFQIQDQGIGIPQDDLEKLFESFGRASNVGSIPGTGLGLSIVKKCVDVHGGTIAVDSQIGTGTTFTITLPLHYQPASHCSVSDTE